jgi:hypothetical protein
MEEEEAMAVEEWELGEEEEEEEEEEERGRKEERVGRGEQEQL